MILAFGFLLVFLLGWLLVLFFPVVTRKAEQVGLAFLLGIGGYTTALFYANWLGMKLTRGTTLLLLILLIALCVALIRKTIQTLRWPKPDLRKIKRPPLAEIWLVLVIVFLAAAITAKNLYWPVFANDAHSYDGRAKFMVREGDIHIKLLDRGISGQSNLTYPPDFPLALSLSYFWGATRQSKIVITFYFIALLLIFYSQLVRYVSRLNALVFTFFLTISPEMYCHAALGLTNLPAMAYLATGTLYLFIWKREQNRSYLLLAGTLIGLSCGIRADAIFFALVSLGVAVLWTYLGEKHFRDIAVYALLALVLSVSWQIYLRLNLHLSPGQAFDVSQLGDVKRLKDVLHFAWLVAFPSGYHGWTFYIFAIALLINLLTRAKENLPLLLLIGLYLASIIVIYDAANFDVLENMMMHSFKRMLFYFLPLVLYYASMTRGVEGCFRKIMAFQTSNW